MLKKSQRLSRAQFSTYFRSGKRYHFAHMTIIHSPADTFAAAVVVGKKVAKNAVRRNTLKRRIYARLRQLVAQDAASEVFIVILKPSYATLSRTAADEFFTKSIATLSKSK